MADVKKVTGKKRYRKYKLYKGINQYISTKLTAIDIIQFPEQSGQPVFGITGRSIFNMQNLVDNSKFTTFGDLFSYYRVTGVAIEAVGQGGSNNYNFPCALAVFPSGTGNFVIEWNTVRAANICVVLNPFGKSRTYYRVEGSPYRQVDQIPSDLFVAAVGAEANSSRNVANIIWSVKIDIYIKFKTVKI